MKKLTNSGVFWGIVLIFAAVLMILNSLNIGVNYLDGGRIPVIRIVLGVLCAAWLVTEIAALRFSRIFFPIAFILLLFENEIAVLVHAPDYDIYSAWTVLLCAALLTAGVSLIMNGRSRHFTIGKSKSTDGEGTTITLNADFTDKSDAGNADIDCRLSSVTKYIDCAAFTKKRINCEKGSLEIFFENTDSYGGDGELTVTNSLGSVAIHIPDDWYVEGQIDSRLGSVEFPPKTEKSVKALRINGSNSLGSIEISR